MRADEALRRLCVSAAEQTDKLISEAESEISACGRNVEIKRENGTLAAALGGEEELRNEFGTEASPPNPLFSEAAVRSIYSIKEKLKNITGGSNGHK